MASVFPFRPYRYSPAAGSLHDLVTQPYDKITPEMRTRYLSLSPYNLVRVILGEKRTDDTDFDNVYTRAAGHMKDWVERGILKQDTSPSFIVYFQEFTVPDTWERLTRKGFIGLGAVQDYSDGVVHRHEQTLSGPKKDRRLVLEHTQAHFGQIFMLYPDREGAIDQILDEVATSRLPDAEVQDEYGTDHRIWIVNDPVVIGRIQDLMGDKKLLIADGHHRYETALAFRNDNPGRESAGRVMMTFINMYSPGLRILATHRVLSGVPDFDVYKLLERAGETYEVSKIESIDQLKSIFSCKAADKIRIAIAAGKEDHLYLLQRDRNGGLDVRALHEELLEGALGISQEAVREESYIRYVRGIDPAIELVRSGEAQIAFLLEPTTIDQVADTSFGGGVMPQKSTDFYPKLLTGLTIYKLD